MKLTKEKTLKLHRQMWTDMQKALGDNPTQNDRMMFKATWCVTRFPISHVTHNCFLCEYTNQFSGAEREVDCSRCPIVWPCEPCDKDGYFCEGLENRDEKNGYRFIPISKILSLPEREGV